MMPMLDQWNMAYRLYGEMLMMLYVVYTSFFNIALHPILALSYGVISPLASHDRTGTTSFIGHNDAVSYLVGYEGRRHGICIAYAL
jgi:hypothetical protein